MTNDKLYEPKANGFIIAGFVFLWGFGLLPGAMASAASSSPTAAMGVVLGFAVLMIVVMGILSRGMENS